MTSWESEYRKAILDIQRRKRLAEARALKEFRPGRWNTYEEEAAYWVGYIEALESVLSEVRL